MVTDHSGTFWASADTREATWNWLRSAWGGGAAPDVLAIIGLGRGEVLEALADHGAETRVLAIEPDSAMAGAVATHPIWQAWSASGRLVYLAGPAYDGADQAWRIFPTRFETPAFALNPGLVVTPAVAGAAEVLRKILIGAEENWKARQRFAPRYLTNSLRNLPAIVTGPSVARLTNAFAGMPAIIVGAGPSLDRLHQDLRQAEGRAVIIATDTALRPLLLNGITPHLVVGLDPGEANARHFFSLPDCAGTWLVAESALDARAAAAFAGRTFWFRASEHHPWPWLRSLGAEDGHLEVWGSVLTGAFQVAALAGCDPIITAGADFSFVDDRPYARATTLEFDWAWSASFGTTLEGTWRTQVECSDVQRHPDVRGVDTATTPVLLAFRDWVLAQARKGSRRIVNASGAGMLFGPGIEQAALADVLGDPIAIPACRDLAARSNHVRPSAVARVVRTLSRDLANGKTDVAPLPDWTAFTGGSLHAGSVVAALDEAATVLETKRGSAAAPTSIPWNLIDREERGRLVNALPELTLRMRMGLRGDAPGERPDGNSGGPASASLFCGLRWLHDIVSQVQAGPDFVSWPDPALVGSVPAAGIAMWPDTVRWSVTVFEAILGRAWGSPVPRPVPLPFAEGAIVPREATGRARGRKGLPRPFARHAGVLLAIEWLTAVASLDADAAAALQPVLSRVSALERLMRTWPVPEHPGAQAELVIEAFYRDSTATVVLPLGLADVTLARMASGTAFDVDTERWTWGQATAGDLEVRVCHQLETPAPRTHPRGSLAVRSTRDVGPVVPRRLTHAGWPAAVLGGPLEDRVLCVTPFTNATSVVTEDGEVRLYQTWPRTITGALSLGPAGDIAWSNVWNQKTGARPYLMHRSSGSGEVEVVDLPFRPSAGVWWKSRVFWNGQPTPEVRGRVGSWAPGHIPRIELADLTLCPIVPLDDRLCLTPLILDNGDAVLRSAATHGWHWIPGQKPVPAMNGPHGMPTSIAVSDGWTATAHPHADLIRVTDADGRDTVLRCYYPMRLAWAGSSLVVMTGDRELLLFERLR